MAGHKSSRGDNSSSNDRARTEETERLRGSRRGGERTVASPTNMLSDQTYSSYRIRDEPLSQRQRSDSPRMTEPYGTTSVASSYGYGDGGLATQTQSYEPSPASAELGVGSRYISSMPGAYEGNIAPQERVYSGYGAGVMGSRDITTITQSMQAARLEAPVYGEGLLAPQMGGGERTMATAQPQERVGQLVYNTKTKMLQRITNQSETARDEKVNRGNLSMMLRGEVQKNHKTPPKNVGHLKLVTPEKVEDYREDLQTERKQVQDRLKERNWSSWQWSQEFANEKQKLAMIEKQLDLLDTTHIGIKSENVSTSVIEVRRRDAGEQNWQVVYNSKTGELQEITNRNATAKAEKVDGGHLGQMLRGEIPPRAKNPKKHVEHLWLVTPEDVERCRRDLQTERQRLVTKLDGIQWSSTAIEKDRHKLASVNKQLQLITPLHVPERFRPRYEQERVAPQQQSGVEQSRGSDRQYTVGSEGGYRAQPEYGGGGDYGYGQQPVAQSGEGATWPGSGFIPNRSMTDQYSSAVEGRGDMTQTASIGDYTRNNADQYISSQGGQGFEYNPGSTSGQWSTIENEYYERYYNNRPPER